MAAANHQLLIAEPVSIIPLDDAHADSVPAAIAGTDGNGIVRLTLPRPLPDGANVRLEMAGKYSAHGRVLYSIRRGESHIATIQTNQDERRRDVRISVAEDAQVLSMEPKRAPVNCDACVVDVSKSGIGLITDIYIPRDILLKVTLAEGIVFGAVRHCSPLPHDPKCFKVGVEIETAILRDATGESSWSFMLKSLWSTVSAARQAFARRIRRDWIN